MALVESRHSDSAVGEGPCPSTNRFFLLKIILPQFLFFKPSCFALLAELGQDQAFVLIYPALLLRNSGKWTIF